jgi:hypothetical protein
LAGPVLSGAQGEADAEFVAFGLCAFYPDPTAVGCYDLLADGRIRIGTFTQLIWWEAFSTGLTLKGDNNSNAPSRRLN